MQDNNMNDINSERCTNSIGDYNNNTTNNDSFNTYNYLTTMNIYSPAVDPINNSNNRTILKDLVGQRIQIWGYAVREFNRFTDNNGKPYVRYTVTNIHSEDKYISDHIQLGLPFELYDEDIERHVIMADGFVYEYDSSFGKKQSIIATEVNLSIANELSINKDFILPKYNLSEEDITNTMYKIADYQPDKKFKLLLKANNYLNNMIMGMPKDFISNYIINHYMINENPDSINRADLSILQNDELSIMETMLLILSVAKRLSEGSFNSIYQMFDFINAVLNNMQGFEPDTSIKDIKVKKFPRQIKLFCDNHKLNYRRSYNYIKTRNNNFSGMVINKAIVYREGLEIAYAILERDDYRKVIKENAN